MIARIFVAALLVCATAVVYGQDDAEVAPESFLGYLKAGMHIGVQSAEGTTDVRLHVYSEQAYETAGEIAGLRTAERRASEVAETNEAVRDEFAKYIDRHEIPESETDSIRLWPLFRTSFATVRVVGSDYILVQLKDDAERRKVIPKSSIGAIYLNANPIRFIDRGARARNGKAG